MANYFTVMYTCLLLPPKEQHYRVSKNWRINFIKLILLSSIFKVNKN